LGTLIGILNKSMDITINIFFPVCGFENSWEEGVNAEITLEVFERLLKDFQKPMKTP